MPASFSTNLPLNLTTNAKVCAFIGRDFLLIPYLRNKDLNTGKTFKRETVGGEEVDKKLGNIGGRMLEWGKSQLITVSVA